jgi:hypothetical protein
MRRTIWVDGVNRSSQRLGHDLAAEQPLAPGVAGHSPDVGIGPVRLKVEQVAEVDITNTWCACRFSHASVLPDRSARSHGLRLCWT